MRGNFFTVDEPVWGLSAGTGKLCIFGHLGLVFIWSCFVSCLLLLLYYVICAPVLTEGTLVCSYFNRQEYSIFYSAAFIHTIDRAFSSSRANLNATKVNKKPLRGCLWSTHARHSITASKSTSHSQI